MTCVARAPNGVILLFVDLAASPAWTRLTSREQTIVALAVAGWPARRIAKHGHERSARTVENQLARVFRKLGISGRAQLLAHLFSRAATSSISSVRAAVRQ